MIKNYFIQHHILLPLPWEQDRFITIQRMGGHWTIYTQQTGLKPEAISEWTFLNETSENSAYKNMNWFYQSHCCTGTSYTSAR